MSGGDPVDLARAPAWRKRQRSRRHRCARSDDVVDEHHDEARRPPPRHLGAAQPVDPTLPGLGWARVPDEEAPAAHPEASGDLTGQKLGLVVPALSGALRRSWAAR